MYATKTKKITSYGRRAQRFVAVADDRPSKVCEENEDLDTSKPPSFVVCKSSGKTPKHRLSLTPPAQRKATRNLRVQRLITDYTISKGSPIPAKKAPFISGPSRPPLGVYQANVPDSPALPPKHVTKRASRTGKCTPLRSIAPLVDMDIILFDGAGRRVSQERRLSRQDVQVNMAGSSEKRKNVRKVKATGVLEIKRNVAISEASIVTVHSSASEDEEYVPRHAQYRAKGKGKVVAQGPASKVLKSMPRRVILTSSDDEANDSDDEEIEILARKPARTTRKAREVILSTESESDPRLKSKHKPTSKLAPTQTFKGKNELNSKLQPQSTLKTDESELEFNHLNSKDPTKSKPRASRCQVDTLIPPSPKPHISSSDLKSPQPKKSLVEAPVYARPSLEPSHIDHGVYSNLHKSSPYSNHVPRPRKLTPIRPNRSAHLFRSKRTVPPSSPNPEDSDYLDLDPSLDIDVELEKLNLSVTLEPSLVFDQRTSTAPSLQPREREPVSFVQPINTVSVATRPPVPEYLRPLLSECAQDNPFDFAAFIETFPFDPIINSSSALSSTSTSTLEVPRFLKIGEASYSEVFGIGDVVLKVIPLRNEDEGQDAEADEDGPFPSDAKDVVKEIIVTRAMGEICDGFITLLRTNVVQGVYPPQLLSLWDEYNERKGSEGIRPESFSPSQMFAIIILPNGGPDLEAFSFTGPSSKMGWRQACSIFWQVAKSLAKAEELVRFEHRDLHWGQILVKQTETAASAQSNAKALRKPRDTVAPRTEVKPMDDLSYGVKVTIIDLGLARIDKTHSNADEEGTYWTPFDPVTFEGEGDYQFDIYRMMKQHNTDSWEDYRPFTNVMWLHYLCMKLLCAKRLRPPTNTVARKSINAVVAAARTREKVCYECLKEMEDILGKTVVAATKKSAMRVKGRRTQATEKVGLQYTSAGDVVYFAKDRGWIE